MYRWKKLSTALHCKFSILLHACTSRSVDVVTHLAQVLLRLAKPHSTGQVCVWDLHCYVASAYLALVDQHNPSPAVFAARSVVLPEVASCVTTTACMQLSAHCMSQCLHASEATPTVKQANRKVLRGFLTLFCADVTQLCMLSLTLLQRNAA